MSFFFTKNKPTLSFVFDLRDSSISAAVVRFEIDKKPEIIICKNFELKQYDSKYYKEYVSSMIRVLDNAIVSVRKQLIKIGNKEKIGAHYFFIGSPWCVSQSKTIKIIKDMPFEINNAFLKKIIVGEEEIFEKNLEEKSLEPNWKVLEETIIQSKLNGYKVNDIFGKRTTDLTIELFVSFIPFEINEKLSSYVNEKIGKKIERKNNSCILASYSFLRDLYSDKNDFIYVDLGKLITDIYVVKDDVVFGIASFPFGEDNIMQVSLARTNLSKGIFTSHISIGHDNKFDLISHNKGEDLLIHGFDLWKDKLRDSLSKICTEMNIPNNLFIIKSSLVSGMLIDELSKKDGDKPFLMLGSKIEVLTITENVINNYILNGRAFMNEPYIKIDLVFLDNTFKQKL